MALTTPRSIAAEQQPAPPASGRLPVIDPNRCTGCGRCVASCDLNLLSLETVRWQKSSVLRDADRCTGCSVCAVKCPFHAITMRTPPARAADPA